MTDPSPLQVPDAPPCTPWCTKEHEDDSSWDEIYPGVEYVKTCRAEIADVATVRVRLRRFADFDVRSGLLRVDESEVVLDDEALQPDEIGTLIAKLAEAVAMSSWPAGT